MRKGWLAVMLASFFGVIACSAMAESYSYEDLRMSLQLPEGVYETQLTADNLQQNESFLLAKGDTVEQAASRFENEGIRLMAYDSDTDRVFIVTAVADAQAQLYFDINNQTPEIRAEYRVNHANGTYYGTQGYKFESVEWKNFGDNQGRFLMMKYRLLENNTTIYRGLQRRTIRNGYTITLDMQVYGRSVTAGDITALNKIQDTLSFSAILTPPDLPITFEVTSSPPEETNTSDFKMTGITNKNAKLTAVLMSMTSADALLFETTASSTGAFTLKISLPEEGFYYMTLTVEAEGAIGTSADYTINYEAELLPFNLDEPIPETLTGDTLKISGTTLSGVTVQLIVNGKNTTKKTGNNKTFSFTVDTGAEGTYQFELWLTKKNYETRTFSYTAVRSFTDAERIQKIKDASISPAYNKLTGSIDYYTGRTMRYSGYITSVNEVAGQWIAFFATSLSGGKYGNYIVIACDEEPVFISGTELTVYGTLNGNHYTYIEGGNDQIYPLFSLLFFEENAS